MYYKKIRRSSSSFQGALIAQNWFSRSKDKDKLFTCPITFVRVAVYENLALPIQMNKKLSDYSFMWMHQRTQEAKNCWLYIRNEKFMKFLLLGAKNTFF